MLIVGAPGTTVNIHPGAGQAYIFRDSGTSWAQEEILSARVPDDNENFGYSVSISGDGALVSAPYEDGEFAFKIGAAYVFRYNSGTQEWDDEVRLTACDEAGNSEYGISVSLDGIHAAIGAREIQAPQDAGSAYTYRNLSSGWVDLDKFSAFDDDTQDALGSSISISGDKVLVGAPFWDDTLNGAEGAIYNFEGVQCPWDLNNDGVVSTVDLLELFAQWGTNGPADFDGSGSVDTLDLLALFANWGPCYCGGLEPLTLEEELDDACISEEEWDDYEDIMQNGTQAEKDNYQCWMLHWIEDCNRCACIGQSGCPGPDPFD